MVHNYRDEACTCLQYIYRMLSPHQLTLININNISANLMKQVCLTILQYRTVCVNSSLVSIQSKDLLPVVDIMTDKEKCGFNLSVFFIKKV